MNRIGSLLVLARAYDTPPMLAAVAVGAAYAAFDAHPFRWGAFALTLAGAFFAQLGGNVVVDALDHRPAREIAPDAAWIVVAGSWTVALACGLALVPLSGSATLVLGFAGIVVTLLYAAPPLALRALGRGLGEAAVFVLLGPLPVAAGFAAQGGVLSQGVVVASLPAGFFAAAVAYIGHFPRRTEDEAAGWLTPAVTLGETGARAGCLALPVLAYAAVALAVVMGEYPRMAYASFGTALPLGWKLARLKATHSVETYRGLARWASAAAAATGLLIAAALFGAALFRS